MNMTLPGILMLTLLAGGVSARDASAQSEHEHGTPPTAAQADVTAPMTDGVIRKVDTAAQKLTVQHGRIENLDMSPMTMVFRVKDSAFLSTVKPGDKVKMTVERVDGALTIVALQHAP
jgi:Cu/Ag efflux protein CusF